VSVVQTTPYAPPSSGSEVVGASTPWRRLIGLVVAIAAASVLGVALSLTPDPAGHGTHHQLGLPACNWMKSPINMPCPTCGMTTSFSHAVRGEVLQAVRAQPFGFLLAIATGCALLMGLYVAATAAPVMGLLGRLWRPRVIWTLVALFAAAWLFKILDFREVI
jgi:hypothetical protein